MFPVLFHVGSFYLRSYDVLTALGVAISFMFLKTRRTQMGLRTEADLWTFMAVLVASGFVGARLLGMVVGGARTSTPFWQRLSALHGEFSIFGLVAGVAVGTCLFSRAKKVPYVRLLDYVAFVIPVWLVWGRIGCYLNGCCYGRPPRAHLAWSVSFTSPEAALPRGLLGVPLHPAQLYEAGGSVGLLALLFLVLRCTESGRCGQGMVCVACLAGYGALRLVVEWFRGDSLPLPGTPFTVGQAFSLALILAAGVIAVVTRRDLRNTRAAPRFMA